MATEQKLLETFRPIAKEDGAAKDICGTYYFFGSELACLRLAYAYRRCGERVATAWSENLKTFYFSLEPVV
jgi:hypothetical protein